MKILDEPVTTSALDKEKVSTGRTARWGKMVSIPGWLEAGWGNPVRMFMEALSLRLMTPPSFPADLDKTHSPASLLLRHSVVLDLRLKPTLSLRFCSEYSLVPPGQDQKMLAFYEFMFSEHFYWQPVLSTSYISFWPLEFFLANLLCAKLLEWLFQEASVCMKAFHDLPYSWTLMESPEHSSPGP